MPSRPSSAYDGDLRADLLAAAEAEVGEHGSASVSLRAIARRAGVSHAAPAHHFGDKAGVLTALAVEGFQRLTAAMRTAIDAMPSDGEQAAEVRAAGMGYVTFALNNPALFDVMWRRSLLHRDDPDLQRHGDEAFQVLVDAIACATAEGWGRGRDERMLALLAWSMVHGLAALWLDGPIAEEVGDDGRPEDVLAAVGGILIEALASGGRR